MCQFATLVATTEYLNLGPVAKLSLNQMQLVGFRECQILDIGGILSRTFKSTTDSRRSTRASFRCSPSVIEVLPQSESLV